MPTKLSMEEVKLKLSDRNNRIPNKKVFCLNIDDYISMKSNNLKFTCINDHIWTAPLGRIIQNDSGCPICNTSHLSVTNRRDISKINDILNNKFLGFSFPNILTEYKNNKSKITVICPVNHNSLRPLASLLNSSGACSICNKMIRFEKTKQNFYNKCKQRHGNKYDYTQTDFIGYNIGSKKIQIVCKQHGLFIQNSDDHITGHGCPKCAEPATSYKALTWLDYIAAKMCINIQHAANGGEFQIPNTLYKVDGYSTDTTPPTCFEFDGDAYHGNPNRYDKNDTPNPFSKLTTDELYQKTLLKHNKIRELGYNLITIWEYDWDLLGIPNKSYSINSFKTNKILSEDISIYGMELIEPFISYKHKHNFRCLKCDKVFQTSISSRKQMFKQHGSYGCLSC